MDIDFKKKEFIAGLLLSGAIGIGLYLLKAGTSSDDNNK